MAGNKKSYDEQLYEDYKRTKDESYMERLKILVELGSIQLNRIEFSR